MITKLKVSNFKAVRELEIALGAINVLVGSNNSGKTSVIHAVQFSVASAQSARINSRAKWNFADYDTTLGPEQLLWSPTENAFALANGASLTRVKPIRVEFETDDNTACTLELARGKNRNLTLRLKGKVLGEAIQSLQSPFSVYVPGLAGISPTERYLSPGLVRRMVAQGDANLAFRNVLLQLKEDDTKWGTFEARFHELFPGYAIKVSFEQQYDEHIGVITTSPFGEERPIDTAGTGMLQVIQVLAYAGLYEPKLLLLDEPDAHLHPNNQRLLCSVIKRVVEDSDTQIIISTHSQHIMEAMLPIAKLHWVQAGELVDFVETNRIPILADLGALGLQDKLISGRTRCLVITEDSDTTALSALLDSCGFRMEETEIASYNGSSNIVAARVLAEFVKAMAPSVVVVVHRDRDGMSDGESGEWVAKLAAEGIKAFVTKGNDVEAYFLETPHVLALCPDLTLEDAEDIVRQAHEDLKEESIARLVNIRSERNFKLPNDTRKDPGSISIEAHRDYERFPAVFVNSKRAVKLIAAKLQERLRKNVRLITSTAHIQDESLSQFVLDLWPEEPIVA